MSSALANGVPQGASLAAQGMALPRGRIVRGEARVHQRRLHVVVFAAVVTGLAVTTLARESLGAPTHAALAAAATLILTLMVAHGLRYPGAEVGDDPAVERWLARGHALVGAYFVWLGVSSWLALRPGIGALPLTSLMTVNLAMAAVAMQLLSLHGRVVVAWILLGLLPLPIKLVSDSSLPHNALLGLIFGAGVFVLWVVTNNERKHFLRVLGLRWQGEQLAAQLDQHRRAADLALAEADRASRARTKFFAAASHDLRQPIHALGLFAQALRERSRDPSVVDLVVSILRSVDVLEGLFNEVMDLSRIDAGGVEARPRHVRVEEIFERLRVQFETMAFDKGLTLHFKGGREVAYADALLVERVMQNLLSNALRYTEDGGVLVSCRRRGRHLKLQVWDTGAGIPADHLGRIFDEFYRVPALEPQDANTRKGLGLGLSIVQRLATVIGTKVHVRTVPGRGSVFGILLPRGDAQQVEVATPSSDAGAADLRGRVVWLIEDEEPVREAMSLVLRGWGATVEDFADHATLSAHLQAHWGPRTGAPDGRARAPDLILADYALPNGRTGLEAIRAIRDAVGERAGGGPCPAVMITGAPLQEIEADAKRADVHLLNKPVMPAKLRALLAFKLAPNRGEGRPRTGT